MVVILEMAPVLWRRYSRAVLASATDTESPLGARMDDPPTAGHEVAPLLRRRRSHFRMGDAAGEDQGRYTEHADHSTHRSPPLALKQCDQIGLVQTYWIPAVADAITTSATPNTVA